MPDFRYGGPRVAEKNKPEVTVQLTDFIDLDGLISEDNYTSRRPSKGTSTFKGYREERPARIILFITIYAAEYQLVQTLRKEITAPVLVLLEDMKELAISATKDSSTELFFRDVLPNLHKFSMVAEYYDDLPLFYGTLEFHLNGFLHLSVMKRGGFKKSTSR